MPQNSQLAIATKVATQDIERVELGQVAKMRVDACPYSNYGILNGTVTGISPDAIVTNQNSDRFSSANPNLTYFDVAIKPEGNTLGNETLQCQLKPRMKAEVNIIAREETLLRFILRKARLLSNI
jgi:HlyD family secretion protein